MGLSVSSKHINGHEYKVRQLGANKGRSVLIRLSKLVGPMAASVAAAKDKETALETAAQAAFAAITEEDFKFVCDTFAESTDVVMPDGREPQLSKIFDLHFAGEYLTMIQWLAFCVEVNFGSFFAAGRRSPDTAATT